MNRSTPMKRTGFKRKPGSPFNSLANRKTTLQRSAIKQRMHKPTVAEGSKFIDACRGEECYLRVPGVCCSIGFAHESVVDCHSNQSRHGKAGARKADNIFTVPGCSACHSFIDQNRVGTPKQEKYDIWDRAYAEWASVRARKMGIEINQLEVEHV